ncbi:MAG TPA: hypothetical protein ENJ73_00555 [Desulfobacterales bacterium]|nr:hypothetical protein [Desulfobacterales bacterium]
MSKKVVLRLGVAGGALLFLWGGAAIIAGLAQVDWQVGRLMVQYMTAIGMIREFHTFVDFYTHVKGVEYLICLAFFVAFPVYYSMLNKKADTASTT